MAQTQETPLRLAVLKTPVMTRLLRLGVFKMGLRTAGERALGRRLAFCTPQRRAVAGLKMGRVTKGEGFLRH